MNYTANQLVIKIDDKQAKEVIIAMIWFEETAEETAKIVSIEVI